MKYAAILAILLTTPAMGADWVFTSHSDSEWVFTEKPERRTLDELPGYYFDPFGVHEAENFGDIERPELGFDRTPAPVPCDRQATDMLSVPQTLNQCPGGNCPLPRTLYQPLPTVTIPDYSAPKSPAVAPLSLRQQLTLFAETASAAELDKIHSAAHGTTAYTQGPPGWKREHVLDHIRDANDAALKRMANSVGLIQGETAYDDRRYATPKAVQPAQPAAIGNGTGPIRRLIQRQPVRSFFRRIRSRFGRGC